ncbi:hypothetical protein BV20DRAFT_872600 [Pilatotrama ljubarskyi]|nr:hypothetical protein BV20DRAFT_872600 [Pilatotrama ljubarskyi]
MASPYPRSPASNIPYAGVSTAPTYPYPYPPRGRPTRYDTNASAASLDSDSSSTADPDDHPARFKPGGGGGPLRVVQDQSASNSKEANAWERGRPAAPAAVDFRPMARTPSPTPSEAKELAKTSVFDWEAMMKSSYWLRKQWLWYYVAFTVALVGVILFTVYHKQIVHWLRPAADWMHE